MPDFNPYSPISLPHGPENKKASIRAQLMPPAIGLISISILHMLVGAFVIAVALSAKNATPEDYSRFVTFAVFYGITMIYTAVLIVGAIGMMWRGSYRWAMTTCALALLPIIGPCHVMAIPFGLWALMVLERPNARQAFKNDQ